jgi:NAD(P)-dependent dehydrogenase (short-subunit alcohol dehydrogenase family)
LVNNAATRGSLLPSTVLESITRDDFLAEMDVKVLGYLFTTQLLAPAMKESGWGRVINIAGLAALLTGSTVGSIRNVAVAAMTKNLADELGPYGITVNCIHPGVTCPPSEPGQPVEPASLANSIERPIHHADLGPLAAFLASPLSFVLNGAILEGFGGLPRYIRY